MAVGGVINISAVKHRCASPMMKGKKKIYVIKIADHYSYQTKT